MNSYKTDILLHSGIKGMHWGIRKYRNYDGSLTPAGKIRYGVNAEGRGASAHTTVNERKAIRQVSRQGPKDIGENRDPEVRDRTETIRLSNQELAARIERMKLEREYNSLINPTPAKKKSILARLGDASKDLKGIIDLGTSVSKLYKSITDITDQKNKSKDKSTIKEPDVASEPVESPLLGLPPGDSGKKKKKKK